MSKRPISPELIEETIRVFQPQFTKPLQPADAEEIIWRWSGYIKIASAAAQAMSSGGQTFE